MQRWSAIFVKIIYVAWLEKKLASSLMCWRPACLKISSERRSKLLDLSSSVLESLNQDLFELRLSSMIVSMFELRRDSRTSSPIFSSLSLSLLNSYMFKTSMGGLFWTIYWNILAIDSLPTSVRLSMLLSCNTETREQMLASRDTTSSWYGSDFCLNWSKMSFSRLWSSS